MQKPYKDTINISFPPLFPDFNFEIIQFYFSFLYLCVDIKKELIHKDNYICMQPNPNTIYPIKGNKQVTYVKPTIKNPNIFVGEFTYFSDEDFEKHVTHHFDIYGDKLIIGKFCQIAKEVKFIMNGANHQMASPSTYPFHLFEGWRNDMPAIEQFPYKGDTIIGDDVWIGESSTILPGVHIEDGAIIGANSTVGTHIPAYSIAVGNPAQVIKQRFDDEMVSLLEELQWWNKSIEEIQKLIPLLTNNNIAITKQQLKAYLTD